MSVFLFLDYEYKKTSLRTPEEALKHIHHPRVKIGEIIDTEKIENKHIAFVFFYTKIKYPKDYLGVATFRKYKNSWKFVRMDGVGNIISSNSNTLDTGIPLTDLGLNNRYYWIGFITKNITNVKIGTHNAKIIPLNHKDLNIFVYFRQTSTHNNIIRFLNINGNEVSKGIF